MPGRTSNPSMPYGFCKYSTQSFQSPSGSFKINFNKNPMTGEVAWGLDYKGVFNNTSEAEGIP